MEENVITMQDIFVWEQTGTGNKVVMGMHVSTGVRPKFVDKIKAMGGEINFQYFDKNYRHTYLTKTIPAGIQAQSTPKDPRLVQRQDASQNKRTAHPDLDILRRLKR